MIKAKKSPKDYWLLAKRSYINFERGNYNESLKEAEKAYKLAPDNPVIMWVYGRALYITRKTDKSLAIFKKIIRKNPKRIAESLGWTKNKAQDLINTCRFEIAHCYIQLNRLKLAERLLERHLFYRNYINKNYYSIGSARKTLNLIKQIKRQEIIKKPRIWISLLEVKKAPNDKNLKYSGGFTNGLVVARTKNESLRYFDKDLNEMGYKLIRSEDTEEFERRCLKSKISDEIKKLANIAKKTKKSQFGTFVMYPRVRKKINECVL